MAGSAGRATSKVGQIGEMGAGGGSGRSLAHSFKESILLNPAKHVEGAKDR